jgi:hypothetical protein
MDITLDLGPSALGEALTPGDEAVGESGQGQQPPHRQMKPCAGSGWDGQGMGEERKDREERRENRGV